MNYKHIFGPVPSRRLNISLGIDLVPYKTCNLNCIYCECGKTTNHTNIRKHYVDCNEIIFELKNYLKDNPSLDYITFSGAGEPLLNASIGKIINFLKSNYPQYKLALLTNGILLSNFSVLKEIEKVDLIIPSLDAATEEVFYKVNCPVKNIDFHLYLDTLKNLRKHFKNSVWLEIFLVKGINDKKSELKKIDKIIKEISPDKIQLNTVDRPPAFSRVKGLSLEELIEAKNVFSQKVEIIKNFSGKNILNKENLQLIVNCLERRPLTLNDLIALTNLKVNEINKILRKLQEKGMIIETQEKRGTFYSIKNLK